MLGDRKPGYSYSRIDNPTADAFALASLRSRRTASTGRWRPSRSRPGWRRSPRSSWRCAAPARTSWRPRRCTAARSAWSQHVLSRFGVAVQLRRHDRPRRGAGCDAGRTPRWSGPRRSRTPRPRSRTSRAVAAICHDAGVPLCVDSTFAPPPVCRPLRVGSRPRRALGDQVPRRPLRRDRRRRGRRRRAAWPRVRAARIDLGGSLAPDEAFLLHRGLATLPLRVARHCANGATPWPRARRPPGGRAGRLPGPGRAPAARARRQAVRRRSRAGSATARSSRSRRAAAGRPAFGLADALAGRARSPPASAAPTPW